VPWGQRVEFQVAWAHDLPFEADEFDVVTAFDVLEHLTTPDVPLALSEMWRVCRHRAVFSICYEPTRLTVGGESLHPTCKPPPWWADQIERAFSAKPVIAGTRGRVGHYWFVAKGGTQCP
jgi:ubiquinone/menaquinone biosynthesis C-methylase UbiE